ncbi:MULTISPECIES: helix-turn-helix transcriptional regulator [unclassified Nocardiopsis]|uniref:helix-turn-helix transcriptional regulator n=1 Tax=unclassified Nocardiopsis TaxID=2649073 RepID=UPI00135B9A6D|nr:MULTISPECIES: helix-turn-helix transcriptional regulator [unclassified Nocardiopsis]
MTSPSLGDYLRAARARLTPRELGLPVHGRRRVAGLRREEVAMLAGMSADYYTRLEQGRETRPSSQVLDALGRALCLDDDGRRHLYRLAGLAPALEVRAERADPSLVDLMGRWHETPALVLGRAYDVLACNPLAEALFRRFPFSRNLALAVFLDPAARSFYPDWETVAANTADGLRLAEGARPEHPRLRSVVAELEERSPDFARLWRRNGVRGKSLEAKRFDHPDVGPLELGLHAFDVRSAPGQELVVYLAEPGSRSAESLSLLGTLAADPTGS